MINVTTSLAHDRKHPAAGPDASQPDTPPHTSEATRAETRAFDGEQSDEPMDIENAQSTINNICGPRYKLSRALLGASNASHQPGWHAFQARDEFLGRSVVVRLAAADRAPQVASINQLVARARAMASVNEHLISRTYDAVVQNSTAPVTSADQRSEDTNVTHALIVSSYFEGPTLEELIADDSQVDAGALLESLHGRLGALDQANLSLGVLRSDQIVMTEDGPAIAAPAVGSVSEIGPTDLTGVCDSLGVDPTQIARLHASASSDGEAKGTMRETGQDDPADTDAIARYSEDESPLGDDFYDDPPGDAGDDGNDGNGGDMGNGQDEPKRNKFVLAAAVLLSLCALLVIGWFVGLLIGGVFSSDTQKSTAAGGSSASSAAPPASQAKPQTGQPIPITGAKLLDPPPGDGQENPDRIDLSYDGNTGTTWPTLQYKGSANFGNLKPGVGIVYDLDRKSVV